MKPEGPKAATLMDDAVLEETLEDLLGASFDFSAASNGSAQEMLPDGGFYAPPLPMWPGSHAVVFTLPEGKEGRVGTPLEFGVQALWRSYPEEACQIL